MKINPQLKWLLHGVFILFFILTPYVTITMQGSALKVDNAPLIDYNSLWVTKPWLRWCVQNAILIVQFYLVYLFIAPHTIGNKKDYFSYVLWSLVSIIVFIYLIYLFHRGVDTSIGKNYMRFKIRFINSFLYCVAVVAMASVLFLFDHSRELRQKQIESELSFLRSQISPHFLFNSLNNIYSLIVLKSENAAEAMLKLSDLLRFVLYESGENYISLEKEMKYIKDYISLQKLRLNENVKINFSLEGTSSRHVIHPMLLMPFIENAFKHGVSYSEKCSIDISVKIIDGEILLLVKNTIFNNNTEEHKKDNGIGLQNVYRRMQILYPGKHKYIKEINGNLYSISLKINLSEH